MLILDCPNCGARNTQEFRYGGEYNPRPAEPDAADDAAWSSYLYMRHNRLGLQKEWWYHRAGCGLWFLAERDTGSDKVSRTYFWSREQIP